jgi:hypothetical protein
VTVVRTEPEGATYARPNPEAIPEAYRQDVADLFDTWAQVRGRNGLLRSYYVEHNAVKTLGISTPPSFERVQCVTGWCRKAVHAHAMRSVFEGYVFAGHEDASLSRVARQNDLPSLYQQAVASSLVYGVSFLSVMAGTGNQPAAKVRLFSANQAVAIWDKDAGRIACGLVLADVDRNGNPRKYVLHEPNAVVTFERFGTEWTSAEEPNPYGAPLMVPLVNDPDPDRPFGHSMLTPELLGIVDKAMRDVLRMELGAEFFTFPQRYVLGATEGLFSVPSEDEDAEETGEDAEAIVSPQAKWDAYVGAIWAITRDENGDLPQVGQFTPSSAENFTAMFENDAQRFSGATNVPLAQLGVLSNNYTSSDALGAANDPLILEVETMNRRNAAAMEEVARMMMCAKDGCKPSELGERADTVQAYMRDPSKSTFAASADAWVKIGGADNSLVGTDVWYEGVGFSQATIDRIEANKGKADATAELGAIAELLASKGAATDSNGQ